MPNVSSPRLTHAIGALPLARGGRLEDVQVAYEQYGTLSPSGDNAILLCHALTGNARAAGEDGWWDPLIGPGAAFDTDRYAVICSNILGSCYGTTGPTSVDPATGAPFAGSFPVITVGDMVEAQERLLEILGVTSLVTVAGGSLGGLQVLEWMARRPEMLQSAIVVAANLAHAPWTIAFNDCARQAIRNDPAWHGGDYAARGTHPDQGLALARMIAMVSYRSAQSFSVRFDRRVSGMYASGQPRYEVESYLRYQGQKLVDRFDANAYLRITEAMDAFDVGEGRGGAAAALAGFRGRALVVGIDSDILYPAWQQHEIVDVLRQNGSPAEYCEIVTPHGHDAFLIEWEQMTRQIGGFLQQLGG